MKFHRYSLFLGVLGLLTLIQCSSKKLPIRSTISLQGTWQFQIDSAKVGEQQKWYLTQLSDSISLPGSMDMNKKGFLNIDTSTLHLNRKYKYEGIAWYQKQIEIPLDWANKSISLILERTKSTKIWIDGKFVGSSTLLQSIQQFEVGTFLTPGKHTISITVDNSLALTPYGNVHIYTDETVTNWNGIIGEIKLEAKNPTYISDVQVFTNIDTKTATTNIKIDNALSTDNLEVDIEIFKTFKGLKTLVTSQKAKLNTDTLICIPNSLSKDFELWDEYQQPMYEAKVLLSREGITLDEYITSFAMRKFESKLTHFYINDRKTFLRGKHDACVFPLTGYPPMDTSGWMRVFRIAKTYGINHYRFHTWCPPKAAFEAADRIGMLLQIELPLWADIKSDTVKKQLYDEALAMQKRYLNHPSLVMFSLGNEIWADKDSVNNFLSKIKSKDSRVLYTQGSNNHLGFVPPSANSDFFVTVRTPSKQDTSLLHTRLTFWYGESSYGGLLNKIYPNTKMNFDSAVSKIKIPMVSHEIGQFQVYPDFEEIKKYTGILRPTNLEEFKKRLEQSGMFGQNRAFQQASGVLAVLCYKAEIEAALRTTSLAGYQLLDLQDYPGQGTALVGILDAFMESKNIISASEWRNFCNDVVPLALFDKYTWKNNEPLKFDIQIANYSNRNIENRIFVNLLNSKKEIVKSFSLPKSIKNYGNLSQKEPVSFDLSSFKDAEKLTLEILIEDTEYKNSYPIWVYPSKIDSSQINNIRIVNRLDSKILTLLQHGASVLYFPEKTKENSIEGMFNPDFWNYGMFKGLSINYKKPISPGTMGLLIDPKHPIFKNFPTDFYSNWQWWSIIKNSNLLKLNSTDQEFLPIVQMVDNLERNHKLGLIFETKVGKGKLLVCMSQLPKIMDKPEAAQLYQSIINYMNSSDFVPKYEVDLKKLNLN